MRCLTKFFLLKTVKTRISSKNGLESESKRGGETVKRTRQISRENEWTKKGGKLVRSSPARSSVWKKRKKKKKKKDSTSAFLRGSNTFAVLSPLGGLSAAGAINCPL